MLNFLWLGLIVTSAFFAILNGKVPEVVNAVTDSAKLAFEIALGLTGILVFWLGLFKIAEQAGLVQAIAKLIARPMRALFPEIPSDHPAMGAMVMNIAANMLGLNNAATPFGLKAMQQLQTLNHSAVASNSMCTFLAINTSSVTLIPTATMAFLAQAGSPNPSMIITTSLIATTISTLVGITAAKTLQRLPQFAVQPQGETHESNRDQ